tara:strand:- start:97762 stop:98103 length:342 start_codon:yes stop_codon:yes gene_type:complete
MHTLHQRRQRRRPGGHENKMNVIGHQAPGPAQDTLGRAGRDHQIAIERVILLIEEGLLPPVAALGDVVRRPVESKVSLFFTTSIARAIANLSDALELVVLEPGDWRLVGLTAE